MQIFLSSPFPDTGCSRWRHLELGVPGDPFHLQRKHHLKGPRLQWMRKGVKTFIVVFLQSHSRCKWMITLVTIKQAHKPRSYANPQFPSDVKIFLGKSCNYNKETNLLFHFLGPGDETGWAEVAKNKEHQRRLQLRQLENSSRKKTNFSFVGCLPSCRFLTGRSAQLVCSFRQDPGLSEIFECCMLLPTNPSMSEIAHQCLLYFVGVVVNNQEPSSTDLR